MRGRALRAAILLSVLAPMHMHAHHPPVDEHGDDRLSLSILWYYVNGMTYQTDLLYDAEGIPREIVYAPITERHTFAYGGMVALVEYLLTDKLFVGIRTNLIDVNFLRKLAAGDLYLHGSVYLGYHLPQFLSVMPNIALEVQKAPIVAIPKTNWIADGVYNVFLTTSLNYQILQQGSVSFGLFSDLRLRSTIIDPTYELSVFDPSEHLCGLDQDVVDNIVVQYRNLYRFYVSLGADVRLGRWQLDVGWNVDLVDIWLNSGVSLQPVLRPERWDLGNLEVNWRFSL